MKAICLAVVVCALLVYSAEDPLEAGFRNPPPEARPHIYYMLLNGYVNRAHVERELAEYAKAGIGGICIFDIGARGDEKARPPAGPAFLSPESVADLGHVIRTAGRLGMEADLSVSSSWDMGASWVTPEDASMTLVNSSVEIEGGRAVDVALPFPAVPAETPRPVFAREVATIAIPEPERVPGYEFVFKLTGRHRIDRIVIHNAVRGHAKRFAVSVADNDSRFRHVLNGTLEARQGPQEFPVPAVDGKYVRLHLIDGHAAGALRLAEFEVYAGRQNVALSHRALRIVDSADLVRYTSAASQLGAGSAENIYDGVKTNYWESGESASLLVRDHARVVDVSRYLRDGRLIWNAPPGKWVVLRYVCVNTGERLKVPSPHSDGLATDHFSAGATRRYINEVVRRLGDLKASGLRDLYLASYEVRGKVWTPGFLEEFRKRRGYDFVPFLPVLNGGRVGGDDVTARVLFDFRKTQGELLVDAYYRTASDAAHRAGLMIESEAGGPGPPIHQVPVDALQALGAVDNVRGEFWPDRMDLPSIWVVKETATAAHVYGKKRVHMESFTSMQHWQEAPQDLKRSADRAFTEGMNHVVWHTTSHQPPEAGAPGWVYYAGTHLSQNLPWWPMAHAFLKYLARTSFLLQQGVHVADVLYYYGDQGYNFVLPRSGQRDYDVINAEALVGRLSVKEGQLALPTGESYRVLVLPEDRDDIDLGVLRKIEQLVKDGATIVGPRPERSSGYGAYPERDREVKAIAGRMWTSCNARYGKGRVFCGPSFEHLLPAPDFASESNSPVWDYIHRSMGDSEVYFVRGAGESRVAFRVTGKQPELWDPVSGTIRTVSDFEVSGGLTRMQLSLPVDGSVFVVFRRSGQPARTKAPVVETRDVTGPWNVRFENGPAAPASLTMTALRSWTEGDERFFSGTGVYEADVEIPAEWLSGGRLHLELGDLWAVAQVEVNGRDLGPVWARPFRVEIGVAARAGTNRILVRVANNWVNRLVGDARSGTAHTRTNVTTTGAVAAVRWRDVPLRRSGLFGPVRLIFER